MLVAKSLFRILAMKHLFVLALLTATPATAGGPLSVPIDLPACKSIADAHTLMTLNLQDAAATARYIAEKQQSGDCTWLKKGSKVWVMKDMAFRSGDYACLRLDSEIECQWTLDISKLQ